VCVVDPKLPETVSTITLSYAFFGVGTGMQPQAASSGVRQAQPRTANGS
jgi:cytochrome c oxidase assembly protein Cox11